MRRKSISLGIFCAAVFCLALPGAARAQAPSPERVLDWVKKMPAPEPVLLEVIEIQVEGKSVFMGQPFTAGDDWLKTLVFRVRNISDRPVYVFLISFMVPELKREGRNPFFAMPFSIGKMGVTSGGQDMMGAVKPGETVELSFSPRLLKTSLHERAAQIEGGVKQVSILPETILTFEDGSFKRGGIQIR